MEEEWMRDRAILLDLLEKSPQASPQELAQITGRSVSWVKKWRKRLTEGDSHDPHLLCSQSRAHHAPYFRWDIQVTKRIVEMRLSPPENLKQVPGPRALLYYLLIPHLSSLSKSSLLFVNELCARLSQPQTLAKPSGQPGLAALLAYIALPPYDVDLTLEEKKILEHIKRKCLQWHASQTQRNAAKTNSA